jgi:hypothetical protein
MRRSLCIVSPFGSHWLAAVARDVARARPDVG